MGGECCIIIPNNLEDIAFDRIKFLNFCLPVLNKYDKENTGRIQEKYLNLLINDICFEIGNSYDLSHETICELKKDLSIIEPNKEKYITKEEFCEQARDRIIKLIKNLQNIYKKKHFKNKIYPTKFNITEETLKL